MNIAWSLCRGIVSVVLLLTQNIGTGKSPAAGYGNVRRSISTPGDLDASGRIDAADLSVLDLFLAGRVSPRNAPFSAGIPSADMNGDGEVNAADRLLLAAVLAGNEPLIRPGVKLVVVNGTLVDGTGAAPLPDAVLAIGDRGRIVGVGLRGQVEIPAGTEVIDVQGATIMPGFINAHVHDGYSAANLEAWARAGVTTVRDEAINQRGVLLKDLILRRDAAWTNPRYARLVSAGWMITAPGGYGQLGVSTADEAGRWVAEELDAGADLIKVAVEDGIAGRTDQPVLSAAALQAAVAAAHARGKPISAHVTDARFLETIVNAGVDDAAHVTWDLVPDAVFQQMIAQHITMVPTLTVLEAYGSGAGAQANLRRFVALGGSVALGNDYTDIPQNNFPHFELGMPMHEIERMAESGMTAMQIIVAATRNAAHVCGLDDELGTLETGKTADVLVVNGDPLRDLNALTNVRLVIHRGIVI
jgi:imidazolonepropionase-like amidohydrolase